MKNYVVAFQFFPFLLALLFLTLSPFTAIHGKATIEKLTPHFRQAFWGDSMEMVLEKETVKGGASSENSLTFEAEVAGIPVYVLYEFEDDQLFGAGYIGAQDYSQPISYLDDFDKFAKLLTAKYGRPTDKSIVHNQNALEAAANLGLAVNYGYITIIREWHTADTRIHFELTAKEYKIFFNLFYYSKALFHLGEQRYKRQDAESLADF